MTISRNRLELRLTQAERAYLDAEAQRTGLPKATLIRRGALSRLNAPDAKAIGDELTRKMINFFTNGAVDRLLETYQEIQADLKAINER